MKIAKEDLRNYVGKRIRTPGMEENEFRIPLFFGATTFLAFDDDKRDRWCVIDEKWETYEEPKCESHRFYDGVCLKCGAIKPKTVKMWQALYNNYNGVLLISQRLFESEDLAKKDLGSAFIKLVPHTEIEV